MINNLYIEYNAIS